MSKKQFTWVLLLCLVLGSCQKDEEDLSIPEITFDGISSTEVVQFDNQVILTIGYKDSEGDLGEMDPDNNSLKVKDSRLDNPDWYHVPPITPDGQALITEGQFSVELSPLFILGNGSEEFASFSIQIRDRNGNWSNTITSDQVLITEE